MWRADVRVLCCAAWRPIWTTVGAAALLASFLTAALPADAAQSPKVPTIVVDLRGTNSTRAELRRLLLAGPEMLPGAVHGQVMRFYALQHFQPVWTEGKGPLLVTEARDILAKVERHGLRAEDYAEAKARGPLRRAQGVEAAAFEMAMTADLLRYAGDVHDGIVHPKEIDEDVGLPSRDFDAATALAQALETNSLREFLEDLPPAHPEYQRLADALERHRAIDEAGGWPTIRSANDVEALSTRLALEDPEFAALDDPAESDREEAIKRFQGRNGLEQDGLPGRETLTALNIPVSTRIAQIAANMERWRWMPSRLEHRHIAVNVPAQSLAYVRGGETILASRVIVGKKQTRTPILRTTVEAVVANPPWNIPGDIAGRQFLPQLRRNPNFLSSGNIVMVDGPKDDPQGKKIDWKKVRADRFPYRLQQKPSPESALGVLMLDSPNDFDVYLHDTPGKGLFLEGNREISNGCVRVEQIFQLATLAIADDQIAAADVLDAAISGGETQRLTLDEPLPVYMLYWTAIAAEDGTVGFLPDRYGRDERLIAALERLPNPD
jgi:murein L,D-transpeptidase YcbB/YkuD